jgi:hypothetical protein
VSASRLLHRLEGVRSTGPDRWIARCPAHNDRRPSLSIRELDDGRVLLHCFGQCSIQDVLVAVGVEFSDLYPDKIADHLPRERRPFDAYSVLACVALEAEIASLAADNLANSISLTDADRVRLRSAAARLRAAWELASGH